MKTLAVAAILLLVGCASDDPEPSGEAPDVAGMNLADAGSLIDDAGYSTVAHDAWPAIQQTVFGVDNPDDMENPLQAERREWLVLGQCPDIDGGTVELVTARIENVPETVYEEIEQGAFDEVACDF